MDCKIHCRICEHETEIIIEDIKDPAELEEITFLQCESCENDTAWVMEK